VSFIFAGADQLLLSLAHRGSLEHFVEVRNIFFVPQEASMQIEVSPIGFRGAQKLPENA
jgi:hypothetical protein